MELFINLVTAEIFDRAVRTNYFNRLLHHTFSVPLKADAAFPHKSAKEDVIVPLLAILIPKLSKRELNGNITLNSLTSSIGL